MKIIYTAEDLLRILKQHHRYSGEPIKVGHRTQDVLSIEFGAGELAECIVVALGKGDDE